MWVTAILALISNIFESEGARRDTTLHHPAGGLSAAAVGPVRMIYAVTPAALMGIYSR